MTIVQGPLLCLAAVGLLGMLGQVVLLREIAVVCSGSELIWIFGIGVWLFGNGFGMRSAGNPRSAGAYRWSFVGAALSFPMLVSAFRWFFPLLGIPMGVSPSFVQQLMLVIGGMFPSGWMMGRLFRLGIQAWLERGGLAATAYAVECAGGAVGGILSAVCLEAGFQNLALAGMACGCAGIAAVLVPARATHHCRIRSGMIVLWILWGWGVSHIDRIAWLNADFHEAMRSGAQHWMQRDTPAGRLTRVERSGQTLVWFNHQLIWDSEGGSAEERVHLPALLHPDPQRILLAGGAADGALAEALQHRPKQIDVLETDPILVQVASENFPHSSADDSSVSLILQDPRRFLPSTSQRYDLIISTGAEPETAAANRFFTREYALLCRQCLQEGGMVSIRIPGSENYLSAAGVYRLAAVYGALRSVFSEIQVFPGATTVLIASDRPIALEMDDVLRRFETRSLKTRYVHPAYVHYLISNDRRFDLEKRLNRAALPVNTDAHPVCYGASLWLWLSRLSPKLAHFHPEELFRMAPWIWGGFVVLACMVPMGMGILARPNTFSLFSVGLAGFSGMLLENVWMLIYQHLFGVLYRDIGMLFTAFMAGMTAGGWLAVRRGWRRPAERVGFAVLGGCAAAGAAAFPTMNVVPMGAGLFVAGLVLFLIGAAVSVIVAVEIRNAPQWDARLAADVLAGGMAAVLGGLVWIPLLGVPESALVICMACGVRAVFQGKTSHSVSGADGGIPPECP